MIFGNFKEVLHTIALRYFVRKKLPKGHIGKNSVIHTPSLVAEGSLDKIFIGDYCHIDWGNTLYCNGGKFVMKDHSTASIGLTVVTGNHRGKVGEYQMAGSNDNIEGKDIIVEEDVWIAANVTLLAGCTIGRGSIVAAGAVVPGKSYPPYSLLAGVPAKVIGNRFTQDEIKEHERVLYSEDNRLY